MNFFRFTAKYADSMGKAVKEDYLVDALNYTEAEARATQEVGDFAPGEFTITSIRPVSYVDIVKSSGEAYYEVTDELLTLDERTGAERRTKEKYLVLADDVAGALDAYDSYMKGSLADYEVVGVKKTTCLDVFIAL